MGLWKINSVLKKNKAYKKVCYTGIPLFIHGMHNKRITLKTTCGYNYYNHKSFSK